MYVDRGIGRREGTPIRLERHGGNEVLYIEHKDSKEEIERRRRYSLLCVMGACLVVVL